MAALTTNITDAYEPTSWQRYFVEQNVAKNLLIQSGIAVPDPAIAAILNQGGRTFVLPYWNDLPHNVDAASRSKVATDDDTEITAAGIDSSNEIAVKHYRTEMFNFSPLVYYVAGSDPAKVILDRLSNWWTREYQRLALCTLTGIFATALASTHENDISTEDGDNAQSSNKISLDAIETTRFLLGDHYDKFTALIVHSVVYKTMRSLNLVEMVPDSDQPLDIPTYNKMRVLVDDNITTASGGTSGTKYYTYLFGRGAMVFEQIPTVPSIDPAVEIYREPKQGTGAGSVNIITRSQFVLHPRGLAWQLTPASADYPSDAEMESGASWAKVWLTKNIPIARLITNG